MTVGKLAILILVMNYHPNTASMHGEKSLWNIVFRGDLVAVEKHEVKGYERAVRPPGVRLTLQNDKSEILLTSEQGYVAVARE